MGRIEQLAKRFEDHVSLPWTQHLAAPEKTLFVVYPKEEERRLRAKRDLFRQAAVRHGHGWHDVDLDSAFADWMSAQDYAADYFTFPEDIRQKLDTDFTAWVGDRIAKTLARAESNDVVGVFGVGTLFGFARVSSVQKQLEGCVRGRIVFFFPGSHEKNVYHLLDARDGWGYMAVPITLHEVSYT
ncbi:MAG: DUF1788 domain-containing protein [Verrucomicrobia bacterium]|nr:DUF1788 domain-containing protein [Verrucomicrobiota bacterium]